MFRDIANPDYWLSRMKRARYPHHSVFICPLDQWQRIEKRHQRLLLDYVKPNDSVLDAGCGYGRLLSLMPSGWDGNYLGVDLSPDFINIANQYYPKRKFLCGDMREVLPNLPLIEFPQKFDIAIAISMKPMVTANLGADAWHEMESAIKRVANKLLLLEYDEYDNGKLITFGE